MGKYQVAQVNIGRIRAPLDDPRMAGFMNRLDEVNAIAERAPGFVWRLQTTEDNATYFRPYEDERVLMNMSVWETVEAQREYVYGTVHVELLRQEESGGQLGKSSLEFHPKDGLNPKSETLRIDALCIEWSAKKWRRRQSGVVTPWNSSGRPLNG